MIGQSQVTEPLMTALRSDRVGHAYLFSGPRGCGKTTSARILARCLNCAAGPTDTPCGVCDSCVELGRGGGGSLDVVEIDAASHNGVDDARDLRERAIFAPARDRFKIFILDEAHMVTQQGFNALLKLVEEPPAHVKFIFATTEPEKVLGTIRSRTHHYPFRLVPPAAMLEYVQELCESEGVGVEAGVLPLVVRAGGGSPRDTLSLLDQLIAGSDADAEGHVLVRYERAVALLGYTHSELLDEVVDAFAAGDGGGAFAAVDRVVQTGQDPRRFVDDLLERLRDLIVVAATGAGASAVLRGVPDDELERMARQATAFGVHRLSRTADLVVAALDEMTGATSPRLQLELLVARVLTHAGVAQGTAPATAHDLDVAHGAASAAAAPATGRPASPASDIAALGVTAPRDGGSAPTAPRVAAPAAGSPAIASPGAPRIAAPGVAAPTATSPVASPTVASPGAAAPATASPVAAPTVASPAAGPTVASSGAAPKVASSAPAQSAPASGMPAGPERARPADDDAPPPFTDDDAPPPFDDDEAHPFDTAPTPGTEVSATPRPDAPRSAAQGAPSREGAAASAPSSASSGDVPVEGRAPANAATPSSEAPAREPASSAASAPVSSAAPARPSEASRPSKASAPDVASAPSAPDVLSAPSDPAATAEAASSATPSGRSDVPETPESTSPSAPDAPASGRTTSPASSVASAPDDDPSPLEPVAPTPPAIPVGPIELGHVRDAWPEVLGQLEVVSRSSWLTVSTATVVAFDADVLTLAFRTAADLTAFKTRTPEGGPSEDLRQAIQAVLGIRVKYLARLDGDGGPGGSQRRPADAPSSGPGSARGPVPPASGARTASTSAPYASSVTEWAVAPIPSSDGGAPTALAVDDEPDDAVVEPVATAPHAGVVLPPREVAPSVPAPDEVDDDDVIPPADETEAPLPPVVVPRMAPLRGGVQRYGEAVVRQMLGATYVRDEPYEPPTRFS